MPDHSLITGQKISKAKLQRAEELRLESTPAERALWQALRAHRLQGWHFRRQQIIQGFIVDFYCHKASLVIEVDGPVHERQHEEDSHRESELSALGLRILRFTNREVMNDLPAVLNQILSTLAANAPDSPSLQGRG